VSEIEYTVTATIRTASRGAALMTRRELAEAVDDLTTWDDVTDSSVELTTDDDPGSPGTLYADDLAERIAERLGRPGAVEAEAAVDRVRAAADGLDATAVELDASGAPHAVGEAAGLRAAAYRIRAALDGAPVASDG